jgi:LPXTG-motif cell wall-anchored protein
LGFSSLGLTHPPGSRLEQGPPPTNTPTPPVTNTPTNTPTTPPPPTATPTATATGAPTATATTPPSGSAPTRPPGPPAAPATPSTGVKVGACAQTIGPQGVSLGDAPGFAANHVQIVGRDDVVFVAEGPQRADGLWWWKVTTRDGVAGWGINDHLAPFGGECFGLAGGGPAIATAVTVAGHQAQLPATGAGDAALIFAGALVVLLLVAGLMRRRGQRAV